MFGLGMSTVGLWDRWKEKGLPSGPALSTILVVSVRLTVWPGFKALRYICSRNTNLAALFWVLAFVYFSLWVWLWLILLREGGRYKGMILDILSVGTLITVIAVLHDPTLEPALAQVHFSWGLWPALIAIFYLILSRSIQSKTEKSGQG